MSARTIPAQKPHGPLLAELEARGIDVMDAARRCGVRGWYLRAWDRGEMRPAREHESTLIDIVGHEATAALYALTKAGPGRGRINTNPTHVRRAVRTITAFLRLRGEHDFAERVGAIAPDSKR